MSERVSCRPPFEAQRCLYWGLCALGLICFFPLASFSAQNKQNDSLRVLQVMRARQRQRITALEDARDNAQAAIARARRALADARQAGNETAIKIASKAVSVAEQALSSANQDLAEERRVQGFFTASVPASPQPQPDDASLEAMQGSVESYTDVGWKTLPMPPGAVMRPGARIRTSSTGYVYLKFGDGHSVFVEPNSTFRMLLSKGHQIAVKLENGAIHVYRSAVESISERFEVRTPIAIVANRGTEFDLRVDPSGATHLIPYSGEVTLAEQAGVHAHPKIDRWWASELAGNFDMTPLPASALARVVNSGAGARIERQTSIAKPAEAGDVLLRGDRIATNSGLVALQLGDGYRVVIGPESRFEATSQGASSKPLYALLRGRMYVSSGKAGSSSSDVKFLVPNAVATPSRAEFEVRIAKGGLSDFVPLGGSLDIKASEKMLNFGEIPPWWEARR